MTVYKSKFKINKIHVLTMFFFFISVMVYNDVQAEENIGTVVGWTKLPKQTKFEDWTLFCRSARLVAYHNVDISELNLEQEVWNILDGCGKAAAGKVGILTIISDTSAAFSAFAVEFSSCIADTVAEKAKAIELYTETETGEWGSC